MTNATRYNTSIISRCNTVSDIGTISLAAALILSSGFSQAQDLLKWWDSPRLYQSKDGALNELKLRGRYQGQYHLLDSNRGQDDGWEDRRSRFGLDAKWFQKSLETRLDFQSNDGFRDPYDRLVDAYLRWKPNDAVSVTAGKTKPWIGYYDFIQSTNTQPTFERSAIFNQLGIDRATALTIEAKRGALSWQAGLYSNDMDREFGTFGGATSIGAGIGYNAASWADWDRLDFHADWLHSGSDKDDTVLNRFQDTFSATAWAQEGPWGLVLEGFGGLDQLASDGDVFGAYLQPTYDLVPKKLQLVGRYTWATSGDQPLLTGQRRYEASAPDLNPAGKPKGDSYHAVYFGAQYFIHGDQLKLLAGAEYASLQGGKGADDYEGVTWLAGLRFSF